MRVWDVPAGYLNRQSLLAEHRELHGIYSILINGKKGYSRHPETLRWIDALDALTCRHQQLAAEMRLRGYNERTPLPVSKGIAEWPGSFVTEPAEQFLLLRQKYRGKDKGRIALPRSPQELWAQHKYSVMARRIETYRRLGRSVARLRASSSLRDLTLELVLVLRQPPSSGGLANAIEHMWGHVRRHATPDDLESAKNSLRDMLRRTQRLAERLPERYLQSSTALSELEVFLNPFEFRCMK